MEKTIKDWLKQLKYHESNISMFLGIIVVVIVGVLLYNYFNPFAKKPVGEITEESAEQEYLLEVAEDESGKLVPQGLPLSHVVSDGDNLWKISEKYYGNGYNWIDIAAENKLSNPDLLYVDKSLTIPKVALRVPLEEVSSSSELSQTTTISEDNYSVQKGDTLWSIAVRAYQDGYRWPTIFNANSDLIQNPNLIEIGMALKIPR